ncbi:unnamed protein product [Protopolystoma xenopodis]|uniref:Uncharacterized protein n=1 Tax=Protopolystoma xenopodis TaxID=117903 RepID=A0A448XBW6_9PLAT|nr:unnamed protein product [Protopolystoma xenopodis]
MASYLGLERMDNEFAFSIALAGRGRRRNQALPDPMQELLISSSSPNTSALANSATAAAFTQASQYPPPSGVASTASTGQTTHVDTHTDINGPINHVLVGNSTVGTTSAGHHLLDQPIKLSPTNRHILAPDKPRLHPADYMLFEGSTRHDDLPPAAHPIVLHSAMPTSVGRLPGLFTSQAPASRFQLTPTSASTPVYNMSSLPPVAHRFPAGLGLSEGKRTSSESSSLVFEIRDDANLTAGEEEGEEEEEEGEDGDEEDEDDEEEEEEEDEEEGVEDHEDGDEVNMDEDDGDEEDEAEDVGADEMGGRKRRGISVLMDEQYASFYRAPLTPSLSELNGITTGALVEATRTAHSTMSGTASTLVTSAIVNITPNNASNFSVGSGNTQTFSSPSPPLSSFSPCTSGAAAQLQANTTSTPTSTPTPIPMLPSQATTTSRSSSGSAGSLMIASSAGSAGGIATATVKMPSSPEPHEGLGNRISPTRHSQGNDCYHGTDLVTASKLYEHDVVRSLHCLSQPFHSSGLHVSPVPTGGFDHFHELGMLPSRQQGYRHQDQCYQHKHQHLRQRHDPADNNSVVSASSSCSRSSSTGLGLDPDEQEPERQSSGSGLRLDKLSPSKLDETEKDCKTLKTKYH